MNESLRVKWGSRDSNIDNIGSGDGVRGQESNNLVGLEASICKSLKNGRDGVRGLRNSEIGSRSLGCRTTEEEVQLRSTRTVCSTDCSSEVDEVTGRQVGRLEDRELTRYDIVDTAIGIWNWYHIRKQVFWGEGRDD